MLRYAISDRKLFPGNDAEQQRQVIRQAVLLAHEGVDFFQLREKDLDADALFTLACDVRDAVRAGDTRMQVVLNGPHELSERAGVLWHTAAADGIPQPAYSVSCHTTAEVRRWRSHASLLLFAPVFEKRIGSTIVQPGIGLDALRDAVQIVDDTPVLALGGVTETNTPHCIAAGAAGIAGIHLFLRPSRY